VKTILPRNFTKKVSENHIIVLFVAFLFPSSRRNKHKSCRCSQRASAFLPKQNPERRFRGI
jgi:hypothetical protein